MARHFVIGHIVAAPSVQRLGIKLAASFHDDAGHANFAHTLVGHTQHGHLGNIGVGSHQAFNLSGVAIKTAHDEHVFQAIGDFQIPLFIEHTDITRVQPAVFDGFRRGLFIVKITEHDIKTLDQQLAVFAWRQSLAVLINDFDFCARQGFAAVIGHGFHAVFGVAQGAKARTFGLPISGGDFFKAQHIAHLRNQHRRHGGRASDSGVERRNIVILQFFMRQHGEKQRRRPWQKGDFFVLYALQHRGSIKHLMRIDGGTMQKRSQPASFIAKGVEERVDDEEVVTRDQADHTRPFGNGADAGLVPQLHALGFARGAAGKHQIGHIAALQRRFALTDLRQCCCCAASEEALPAQFAGVFRRLAQHDDVL